MTLHRPTIVTPAEEAAQWMELLAHGDEQDPARFAAWLKESPRHVEEMLYASAIDNTLQRLAPDRWPSISDVPRAHGANVTTLSDIEKPVAAASRPRVWRRSLAVAAVITALVIGAWLSFAGTWWQHYSTAIGEQRTLELDDGSLAQLNIRSRIDVRFTPQVREIRLLEGEAVFKVAYDAVRPFVIYADGISIRALGTEFNVYRQPRRTTVSVLEGVVAVGQLHLAAGQQAVIESGQVILARRPDVARASAWRQRRLIFELNPLSDIAREFNRYNKAPQIRVEGEAAGRKVFSGVFDADDPQSFVDLLKGYRDLRVESGSQAILIRPAPEP